MFMSSNYLHILHHVEIKNITKLVLVTLCKIKIFHKLLIFTLFTLCNNWN